MTNTMLLPYYLDIPSKNVVHQNHHIAMLAKKPAVQRLCLAANFCWHRLRRPVRAGRLQSEKC